MGWFGNLKNEVKKTGGVGDGWSGGFFKSKIKPQQSSIHWVKAAF
jgi:hypothetical protein